jgi:23S rRNA pseudouridine1911/1915/1917 synthase
VTPQILYEDDSLLVVNKPVGMVVNRSETVGEGGTLQEWVEGKVKSIKYKVESTEAEEFRSRAGIVHRLDKDTSGVLVVAKTPRAFAALQRQFKERLVKKTYVALVHGKVAPSRGEIALPVGRDPKNRQRFAVLNSGRPATTRYSVLASYSLDANYYTLLQLEPLTGRTHQLRVHLAHLHHPVVADPWYAGRKTARADRSFCPRLFLHAQSLGFTHPATGAWMKFEADLPKELVKVLQNLEKKEDRGA